MHIARQMFLLKIAFAIVFVFLLGLVLVAAGLETQRRSYTYWTTHAIEVMQVIERLEDAWHSTDASVLIDRETNGVFSEQKKLAFSLLERTKFLTSDNGLQQQNCEAARAALESYFHAPTSHTRGRAEAAINVLQDEEFRLLEARYETVRHYRESLASVAVALIVLIFAALIFAAYVTADALSARLGAADKLRDLQSKGTPINGKELAIDKTLLERATQFLEMTEGQAGKI